MHLKILAISDTHLGEDTSLLSFPDGRRHLWRILREYLGNGDKFEVDELILIGDIPDRALSSTSQIITNTNAFVKTMGSVADIKKSVFVIGNHDHTLWTNYLIKREGKNKKYGITGPEGTTFIKDGIALDKNGKELPEDGPIDKREPIEEILKIFNMLDPGGKIRNEVKEKKLTFVIANPVYATQVENKGTPRTIVFAHGTHFRWDVARRHLFMVDKILDRFRSALEKWRETDLHLEKADGLEELEGEIYHYVDSTWSSSGNNPTGLKDSAYYAWVRLQQSFHALGQRKAPDETNLFSREKLERGDIKEIRHLTGDRSILKGSVDEFLDRDPINRFEKYLLPHLLTFLENDPRIEIDLQIPWPTQDMTFVFGDTHHGGWGGLEFRNKNVRIYNTGAWCSFVLHLGCINGIGNNKS